MSEWRRAIRTPLSYTVPGSGNTLVRQQTNFVSFVIISGALVLLVLYAFMPSSSHSTLRSLDEEHGHGHESFGLGCDCSESASSSSSSHNYNHTYPITPIEPLNDGRLKYRIAAVADLDTKSRSLSKSNLYLSYMLYGWLVIDPHSSDDNGIKVELTWDEHEVELTSQYAAGGRGMELSDLAVFNGKLYTCDDRTGIIYEVHDSMVMPWVVLRNGNGETSPKGFKCEWMTVKDGYLYVGGLGKEWTSASGDVILNHDPQWVKRISPLGHVEHLDWRLRYIELRRAAGIEPPGYLIHEAATWSSLNSHWYFLPRRASKQSYDDQLDEQRGTNILLVANDNFTKVTKKAEVGPLVKTHGFSSVKLVPLPPEVKISPVGAELAIAIKSEEDGDSIASYVTVVRLPDGKVLMPETKFSKRKYEGIEFV